ncbi:MAG: hypothetical protein IIX01_03510 [Clostridia bacterium]|nr:hypothetical protein [Clostridia bacterium]
MTVSVIVCALSCAGLIGSVLVKPSVKIKNRSVDIYWLPAFAGAVFLLLSGNLTAKETWNGLTASGEMNPIKILSLFISLTFLSVYLDELGFFKKLASLLIDKAKGSQKKLFLCLYALVSVLTVFTSNDIVVLTFTPFICCFCKEENVSPIPYLVGEFVAANTWSMMLIIGNPTNIYLTSVCGVQFFEYFSVIWFPTVLAGGSAFAVLWLVFRKELSKPVSPTPEDAEIWDRGLLVFGVLHLSACVILLAVSSYIGLPMWIVAVSLAVSLVVCTTVYSLCRRKFRRGTFILRVSFKRSPWTLAPFVLSMFVVVLSLQKYGVTGKIAGVLNGDFSFLKYGVVSLIASNVVNNIPMSVLFGGVLSHGALPIDVYATVVGSNLGAYLTPIGALAGIMWSGLLKRYGVKFSFLDFIKFGALSVLPAAISAFFGLWIVL